MEKSLAYRDSTDIGIKIKIKTETNRFAYVMRAMCQSLSYGNTDQIGRRAWNGFMEYIEKSVATFVNECNAKYKNGKDPKINPRATPDFLPDGIPEFISTTTHNNTYDISIGQITSSLTMEQVMSVYEKAKETEVRKKGNRGPGAASAASTSALTPGPSGDPAAAAADIPEYTQEQKDYRHMREMLKTLSSAMDKPIWDNCTNIDDLCVMPNIKRVPDISVVVDGNDKTLTYPILIGEVLGKKDKGPKYNQLYEGYNATMQCLVFGPRAYYFEIDTTEAALTILKKNPGTGTVTGKKKVYQLAHNDKLLELINDLSAALLDGMLNVRPIAYVTATKLKERNYMDFLSPPPGKGKKLQIHCWHVFVPDYNHSLNEVPEEYNPEVDKENITAPKFGLNQIPDFEDENLDNSVIEVEHFNIKDNADLFDDVSFCHGYRDDFGTPLNMKGRKFSDVWKKKAQEGQEKMIMNDVNKILNTVSEHFRDYLVNKKMRQEIPEINPSGADIKDVWEMKADTKGVYLSLVENDDVVISHLFPPDDKEEDEYAHVDLPQPPEPEHEEHIATLKFPSYTSQKMREYYTQKIKKIRGSNPTEYQMPHSEWTPGRRSTFARQLTKMMEGDDFRDPLSTKLAFTETGESSHMEPLEEEREPGEAERQQREKHAQPQHQAPPQQQQLAQQQAQAPQAPQHQAPPPPPQQQAIPQLQQLAQQAQAPQHQAPPPPPQQQAAPQLQQLAQQAQGPQAPQHQAPPPPPQQQAAPQLQQLAQQAQGPQAPQHQAPPPPPQQQAAPQLQQLAQQAQGPQAPQHQGPPPPPQQQQLAQQQAQAPQHQAPPPPPQQQAAPQLQQLAQQAQGPQAPQHQGPPPPPQQQQLAQQQAQAPQHQAPPPPPPQQAAPQLQQLSQQAQGPQAPQYQAPPPPPQQQAAPQLQQLAQQAQGPQAPQHQGPPPPPQQQQLAQQQAQAPQAPQHQAQPPPPPQQAHRTSVRTKRKPDRYTPSKYESKRPRKQ